MRTTLDFPEDLFREIKAAAAMRGISLKVFIQIAAETELRKSQGKAAHRVKFPLLPSSEPGTLNLTNADIEEVLA